MPEQDQIDRHNAREIDTRGGEWLESVKQAVAENPFGQATCTFKWQHGAVLSVVTNEEKSKRLELKFQR
jgi:hypothetical protein